MLYRNDIHPEGNRLEAEALSAQLSEMVAAYGHTVINEYPASKYIDEDLHRSTSGAMLQLARVPSFTAELGTGHMPDPGIVAAAVSGTRNVLRWADMLDGEMEPITQTKVVDPGYAVRRRRMSYVSEPCVVLHTVEAGDIVREGDVVAETVDAWGRPIGEGVLKTDSDGIVLGRSHGIFYSLGDPVLAMAIPDDEELIGTYPADYFTKPD